MDGEAEEITRKAIEAAKGGDMVAIRLVLDRVAPPARERTIEFRMPQIESPSDLPGAVLAIMEAVADGAITPGEATQLASMLEAYRKQAETADLADRIAALEESHAKS